MSSPFVFVVVTGIGVGIACGVQPRDASAAEVPPATAVGAAAQKTAHPTACSLIDQQEMSRILGSAVGPPEPDENPPLSTTCNYRTASGKGAVPAVQVEIDWQSFEGFLAGAKFAERLIRDGSTSAENIGGLGDAASILRGVMHVRKGNSIITIDLSQQPQPKEKGIAIAQVILARAGDAVK
jgi:hypothetical protein